MDKSSLGDRIKSYEAVEDRRIMPRLPVIVRLDGRSFSKFTKGMKRPFDDDFRQAMINTTKHLVKEANAKIGYTQSDEITLVLHNDNYKNGQLLFDARVQKICSIFASMASTYFLTEVIKRWPEKIEEGGLPSFDCRVFAVPDKMEAYNAVLWREQDATKNSITQVAQCYYTHKQLNGVNGNQKQAMLLKDHNVNWNDFSPASKRGVYVRKCKVNKNIFDGDPKQILGYADSLFPIDDKEFVNLDLGRAALMLSSVLSALFDIKESTGESFDVRDLKKALEFKNFIKLQLSEDVSESSKDALADVIHRLSIGGNQIGRHEIMHEIILIVLKRLFEKHPNGMVARSKVMEVEMPPLSKIANALDVIFNGEDPLTYMHDSE
jgi:tRNA(His) guanylyltransferase